MLKILLSPSRTMDFKRPYSIKNNTIPIFIKESQEIIEILKGLKKADLEKLMKVSPSLADENYKRFRRWKFPYPEDSARPAFIAFKGDVYEAMRADKFTASDLEFAMKQVKILSGLYGLLRPLDMIMPYRLEMGTKLINAKGRNLYKFWGDKITDEINNSVKETGASYVINLASVEYFKSVQVKKLTKPLISLVFTEIVGKKQEVFGIHSKRARGLMTRFIINNRIKEAEDIKEFNVEKYEFNPYLSDENNWVFSR
jgi:uncharacterized protein